MTHLIDFLEPLSHSVLKYFKPRNVHHAKDTCLQALEHIAWCKCLHLALWENSSYNLDLQITKYILVHNLWTLMLLKILPTTPKADLNSSEILSYDFILCSMTKIIQNSRTFTSQVQLLWNQTNAPLLIKSFPKIPRTWSKALQFGGSHNYKTKQTTLLHR